MRAFLRTTLVSLLMLEARLVIKKYRPKIVAVTGSVGKTSTKDAIYAVLSGNGHVRKSDKSFNSEIGLPLTILGCPNAWNNPFAWMQNLLDGLFLLILPTKYPDLLVLEVGADHPGDIRSIAKWLPVDVAVITRLPEVPVHVEFFDSPEAVVEEKASLIQAIKPGGTLVVCADDPRAPMLEERARLRELRVVTFGLSAEADVSLRDSRFLKEHTTSGGEVPMGMSFELSVGTSTAPVSVVGVAGVHTLFSGLAAAAVGYVFEKQLPDIVAGLERYEPPYGRMRLLPGLKDTVVIDDTYNASPAATAAALETLSALAPKGRRIAVLGDMLELGRYSVEEHRKLGSLAVQHADLLVTVGFRARDIAESALDSGMPDSAIFQYEDSYKVGDELVAMLLPGDCVLVKGSQSMRMERVVEALMLEPERASELLVRQSPEWKKR